MVNCHLFTHETLRSLKNSWKGVLAFGSVGFWGEGKTGLSAEKPLGAGERTNNKLNRTRQIIIVVIIIAIFWSSSSSSWSWSWSSSLSSSASPSCNRQTLQLHKASKRLPVTFREQRLQLEAWFDKIQWLVWNCTVRPWLRFIFCACHHHHFSLRQKPHLGHIRCAFCSRIRERFINVKCSFRKPCD